MAWLAFVSIVIVTFMCFFVVDIERLEKLETVVTWFYMAMASIVGAYMGFSTYASVSSGAQEFVPPYDPNSIPDDAYSDAPEQSSIVPDNPDAPVKRRRHPKMPPTTFE